MRRNRLFVFCILALGILAPTVLLVRQSFAGFEQQSAGSNKTRENAYRENNIGVALLEQFKYKEGAEAFKRALQLEPRLGLAHINLCIALYNVPDLAGAERQAKTALTFAADAPQPYYILGLIAKTAKPDEAIAAIQHVLKIDPSDVGANINLGQIYSAQKKYTEAIAAFRLAVAAEPYSGSALYGLSQALMRNNQKEEGLALTQKFKELRERGSATNISNNYLEQGRYAEAVASTGTEPELVNKAVPDVVFADVTAAVLPAGGPWPFTNPLLEQASGAVVLFDYDNDGDLDLLEVSSTAQRLYRNDGGKFTDVTAQSGDLAKGAANVGTAAVAGDFDNDGKADLFILRYQASALYHNDGNGRFTDLTAKAKIPNYSYLSKSVAFVDYDHDGDLDLFIGGGRDISEALKAAKPGESAGTAANAWNPAPGQLLRNNGDGTFTDQTSEAKLSGAIASLAVVPTDFDNRRDIDILIGSTKEVALWRNMRDGTFKNVADVVGLKSGLVSSLSSVAIGDVNKDGFTDFYFAQRDSAGVFALSDGREHFNLKPGPAETSTDANPTLARMTAATQLIDYDNDGLLDLVSSVNVTASDGPKVELRIWRNTGDGWAEVSEKAVRSLTSKLATSLPASGSRVLAAADLDGDGDTDLIFGIPGGGLRVARNDGGNRNHSVRVQLAGKVSNRNGVGCKVELRSGSLQQKLETYSASPAPAPADVIFGLGSREQADAVRIIWPSGVVQSETEFGKSSVAANLATLSATELDRKPSSCPYLYSWNGERFEFITDFMGGGEMGYLEEPGRHNKPDPVEYVRLRGDQLKERNGRFELRVTNELEEALFADRFQLIAVAHPRDLEVYPNEGMSDPPKPFRLFVTRGAHPPLSAFDNHGSDVLGRIAKMDRQYPDDFRRDAIRGYAEEHSLTLKLAHPGTSTANMILLLTGWTDYAWSSDNVAASQSGKAMTLPALQVKDAKGEWRTVIEDIGIPVGRPQTVTVDLSGKFLSPNREVRIVTSMRILWDQILVNTAAVDQRAVQLTRLDPATATLYWRGFSEEGSTDGKEPFGYDYQKVSFTSPWKVMPGRYTREGNVRELLLKADDMFVISKPGDEINLAFNAAFTAAVAGGLDPNVPALL